MRRPRRSPASASGGEPPTPRWAAPQLLIAGFALVLAVAYALTGGSTRPAPPPSMGAGGDTPPQVVVEVRFVVVDAQGLERPGFADVPLAGVDDASARLTAALGALRDDLIARGVWPVTVAAPAGFVIDLDRRRVAVVDMPAPPADLQVDVARELAVVRSVVATARGAIAADEVRVTVAGEERPSLWGKVALPRG
jgi:hypothetical protein